MAAAPCRTIRTVAARMGGAVDDDDDGYDEHGHFHGHDFLDRANVERRVRMVLSEIEKVDKTKLNDLTRSINTQHTKTHSPSERIKCVSPIGERSHVSHTSID